MSDANLDHLRHEQAVRVMPWVSGLLDEWDRIPNDLRDQIRDEAPGLVDHIEQINLAIEGPDKEEFMEESDPVCDGVCLTGADVGVPYSGIAYAHPGCPLHDPD